MHLTRVIFVPAIPTWIHPQPLPIVSHLSAEYRSGTCAALVADHPPKLWLMAKQASGRTIWSLAS